MPVSITQGSTEQSPGLVGTGGSGSQADRPPGLPLSIRVETAIDFDETATLAALGFGAAPNSFKPDKLRWLYERAFSNGSTVLSIYAQDRKVGQVALLHQNVSIEGRLESAIALVDLFILKDFRSRQIMAELYGEVERFCQRSSIRFILAVPNGNGARVNVRYLRLADFLKLDIRAGFCRPWRGGRVVVSANLDRMGEAAALALFARFVPTENAGLFWTPQSLWARFQAPAGDYGVHATDNLLLISSPRTSRGMSHTLFCAFFAKPDGLVRRKDVTSLARAACALHRRPIFVYAGINHDVPLPGFSLPERLRPSAMTVQVRDFQPSDRPIDFARFELLDFDFA